MPPIGERPIVGEGGTGGEWIGAEGDLPAAQVDDQHLLVISGRFDAG